MSLSTDQQATALATAAHQYGIPVSVLTGVYGIETGFGKNLTTSSAGAVGPFQFLPSTAKSYAYPLTNTPTAAQFQQQANAAAHYLSDLFHQTGSWDAALQHYSGGGYGAQRVASSAAHGPLDLLDAILSKGIALGTGDTSLTGGTPATTATQQASNTAGGIGQIADLLTSGQFWLRLGEALAGIILIAMGLRSLTGSTTTPVTLVRKAARA